MKLSYSLRAVLAAACALGSVSMLPAYAQSTATSPDATNASPSTAAPAVDDKKLEQFADAYLAIQALQKEAATQQSATKDPNAAQQQQSELQGKMTDAVQKSGLQVNEFNQIAQAMVTDVDLRQRVIAKVQQRANPGS